MIKHARLGTIVLALVTTASLGGCKKKEEAKVNPPATAPVTPTAGTAAAAVSTSPLTPATTGSAATAPAATATAPAATTATPAAAAGDVDMSSPTKVVEAMFAAAKTGKVEHLAGLCDTKGEIDGDVKELCAMTPTSGRWKEFEEGFANAKVTGEKIKGDEAEVDLTFGPAGDQEQETAKLIQRDGKWYLQGM